MYSSIALVILMIGLDQAYVRFFYRENGIEYKRLLLVNVIKLPIMLAVAIHCTMQVIGDRFIENINENTQLVLVIFGLNLITLILNKISTLTVRLQLKTKLLASLTIIRKVLYVCTVVILVLYFDSHHFLILIFATFFSQLVTSIYAIWKEKKIWMVTNLAKNKEHDSTELLRYGYPFIFSSIVSWIFEAADKLAIKHFGNFEDVGVYAGAINIIALFSIIQTTFNTLWAPMSMEHYEKQPEERDFFALGNQGITIIMFFIGISLILFKDMFAMFLGERYSTVAYIIPFLIFNPIMRTVSETTVNGINFTKRSYLHIYITTGACVFNVIGNFILVPLYGNRGAAISTGLSYIVFFTLRTILANKYYYIDFKLKKFYTLTFATLCYALYNTFFQFGILSVIGYFAIILIIVLLYKDIIGRGVDLLKAKSSVILIKKYFRFRSS